MPAEFLSNVLLCYIFEKSKCLANQMHPAIIYKVYLQLYMMYQVIMRRLLGIVVKPTNQRSQG